MEERICACNIPKNLTESQMYESIAAYVKNLDEDICVEDSEYERRLGICSGCEDIYGGITCRHCGCFVLARAKKKDMFCPKPGKDMWKDGSN